MSPQANTPTTTTTTSVFAPSIPWSTLNRPISTAFSSGGKNDKPSTAARPISAASPSASTILISPTNKVLLLHRRRTSSSFPSAHVFPGGNLDVAQDGELPGSSPTDPARHRDNKAYRTAAIRELFEETGLLLARSSPSSSSSSSSLLTLPLSTRLSGRQQVHDSKVAITDWLDSQFPDQQVQLDTDSLIPFSHWITPTNVPKRFTTQMYLYFTPTSAEQEGRANPDGGAGKESRHLLAMADEIETMAPEWRRASDWIASAQKGEIILFPPQFLLLHFIARFLDTDTYSDPDVDPTSATSTTAAANSAPAPAPALPVNERIRRREALRFFINGGYESNSPASALGNSSRKAKLLGEKEDGEAEEAARSWREKYISPYPIGVWTDGRTILALDRAGEELQKSTLRGDRGYVVLVRMTKEGPREVEVKTREDVQGYLDQTRQRPLSKL